MKMTYLYIPISDRDSVSKRFAIYVMYPVVTFPAGYLVSTIELHDFAGFNETKQNDSTGSADGWKQM